MPPKEDEAEMKIIREQIERQKEQARDQEQRRRAENSTTKSDDKPKKPGD